MQIIAAAHRFFLFDYDELIKHGKIQIKSDRNGTNCFYHWKCCGKYNVG